MKSDAGFSRWIKNTFIGRARDLSDDRLFQKVSLIALFAWVGLGADGLSSSCYGPEESFRALGAHTALIPLVALACAITIAIVCISHTQIIELFPGGGGGYLVASKLLSPAAGAVSGCALLVDYVLTIALSISSGADAMFSVLPPGWQVWKLPFALSVAAALTLMNLRGIKESVLLCAPVFFLFLATHAFAVLFGLLTHLGNVQSVVAETARDISATHSQLGWLGLFLLVVKSYSVGAGTYTGIEAVSNGLTILREPRVATGKRTMLYIGLSLGLTVIGLMFAYMLYHIQPQAGKTLNAVLFGEITAQWPSTWRLAFISTAQFSAMALLFIGSQAGFIDGPRVLASMALDRWVPTRFSTLSDRLVSQNGILMMGGVAMLVILMSRGSVSVMVVLYSINVFVAFTLSQLGMVRHWMAHRDAGSGWRRKVVINGVGFGLTAFILATLCIVKFSEGGWVTIVVTGCLIAAAFLTRRHYRRTLRQLARLDELVHAFENDPLEQSNQPGVDLSVCNPNAKTAVVLVNGFNGLGVHTLFAVLRMFPGMFRNLIFLQAGIVDAGVFKGSGEVEHLKKHIEEQAARYVSRMRKYGFCSEAVTDVGIDIVDTCGDLTDRISQRFPGAIFFGGQLVFANESWITRLFHNFVVFALQRRLFLKGIPFLILPIRV